ncbi:putative bifunctional diguanylate cyclase/phosphodiesterase [Patulibacter defluvii]|uniref:putative bifunctional diguanylate cyclase/phosphodiesterase n=1 Tax=Patulibacter defluvii TaxID=3095358 RepID=UPI002A7557ED|nr:bifunctional diguanylate cyclase/phosphodiesterase [Patulibacter sp. DM4]
MGHTSSPWSAIAVVGQRIPLRVLQLVAGLVALAGVMAIAHAIEGGTTTDVGLRLAETVLAAVALVGTLHRARRTPPGALRAGWISLGGAAVAALVTTAAVTVDPQEPARLGAPSFFDVPSLLVAPLAIVGALLFARPPRDRAQAGRILLDGIAIGCATGLVGWYLVLRPFVDAGVETTPSRGLALAYLGCDAAAMALGLLALLRARRSLRWTVAGAVVALGLLLVSDVARGFAFLPGYAAPDAVTEIGWVLALAIFALAVWIAPGAERRHGRSAPRGWLWWLTLPYLFLMPVAGVLLVAAVRGDADVPMVAGAAVIIAVLGFRHVMALHENAGLTHRLATSVRELEHRAEHDELTGLLNRSGLIGGLDRLRDGHGEGAPVALFFVDVDRFKGINDTLGHTVGDAVLRAIGERLRYATGRDGLAARFAGDEFVLVLTDVGSSAEALARAQDALDLVERPIPLSDGGEVVVTASAGVAISDRLGDGESIVREADLAMFEAKQGGRARIQLFEEGLRERSLDRVRIEQELRRALYRRGEFEVHLQPLVALESDRLWGAEALVRWRHPEHGILLPGRFLSVAEESGLIVPLGYLVLSEACAAAAAVPGMVVSVNLSPRQIHDPGLVPTVADNLALHGLPAERLCLEVTEDVLVDDRTIGVLEDLRALGTRVAIDDFGVGASSLKQLRRIPGALVKIDRSFVMGIDSDEGHDDRVMVKALVTVAEQLGLEVVAEGIERQEQLEAVLELGASIGQGWLLGHPQRAAAFVTAAGSRPLVRRGPRRA